MEHVPFLQLGHLVKSVTLGVGTGVVVGGFWDGVMTEVFVAVLLTESLNVTLDTS